MFTQNKISIASRCPHCCSVIETEISVFNLSGGKISSKCPSCGKSTLDITLSQDGKVRLSVPCVACPHHHPFTLSAETMFTKELFILQCSFTKFDICFMGNKNKVNEAVIKNGKELQAMMDEAAELAGEDEVFDEEALAQMKLILSFIDECAKKGDILCPCQKNKTAPGVELTMHDDSVTLTCRDCGRNVTIDVYDTGFFDTMLEMGKIFLEDNNGIY